MLPNEEEIQEDGTDPLDYLSEKEAAFTQAALIILEEAIEDEELREQIIGGILCEIDDWGIEQEKKKGMH